MSRKIHSDDFADENLSIQEERVFDYSMFRVNTDGQIATITEREFKEDKAYQDFMNSLMVIEINETTDERAPKAGLVGVNGQQLWLPRGKKIKIPRYFVERLLRSRSRGYKSVKNQDPSADAGYKQVRTTNNDYSVSVLQDPAPQGRAWLERVVRESA